MQLREVPQNIQAEQSLLGCIIYNPKKHDEIEGLVSSEDFYFAKHKKIYETMKSMISKKTPIDVVTLIEELNTKSILADCGGASYIAELSGSVIESFNITSYANIVKEKSNRRKLIDAAKELIEKTYSDEDVSEVVENTENKLYSVVNNAAKDMESISDAMEKTLASIEECYRNGGGIVGKTTGYKDIDKALSGLLPGDFILIAARPSMGKTAFALNLAQFASKSAKVAIFSIEMTTDQLTKRMLSSKCLVSFENIKQGSLNDDEFNKIAMASVDLSTRKIHIDDTATRLSDIKAKCRKLKLSQGLDVVLIDYLQLVELGEKIQSREQEVAKISRELKKIAKELGITVIALSQLSRAPEQRADHRPILSDLRESGSIEQDADTIMFIYRDEYYNKESEEKNIAEIIIGKNRNGEVKTVKLGWVGKYQRFGELDYRR